MKRADKNNRQQQEKLDLSKALVLVSCVSKKNTVPGAACSLYCSPWFLKVKELVENQKVDWLILSALYGVVEPNAIIAPYEKTLNRTGIKERREWAKKILDQLGKYLVNRNKIVFFAGQRYREFLVPSLLADGYEVIVPMEHLRVGEQLSWLNTHL